MGPPAPISHESILYYYSLTLRIRDLTPRPPSLRGQGRGLRLPSPFRGGVLRKVSYFNIFFSINEIGKLYMVFVISTKFIEEPYI